MGDDSGEIFKRLVFAGLGFLAELAGKAEEFVEELAELGEVRSKNSEGFIGEIIDRLRAERSELDAVVMDIARDALGMFGLATSADVAAMKQRLAYLERKKARLDAQERAAAAQTAGKTRTAKRAAKKTK